MGIGDWSASSLLDESIARATARNSGIPIQPNAVPSNFTAPNPAPMIGEPPLVSPQAPAADLARTPGAIGRAASKVPGWGMRVARGGLAFAPVAGAAMAAADSQENVAKVANDTGLDYNSFLGRIGANTINFLQKTGNAATLGGAGAIGSKVARLMGGESFFEPYAGAPQTTPASTPTVPSGPGAAPGYQAEVRAVDNALEAPRYAPGQEPTTTLNAGDFEGRPRDWRTPASGTGAVFRPSTGEVINVDSRGSGATGTGFYAPGRTANGLPNIGGFYGATARLRNIAQDNASTIARGKLAVEMAGKGATAAHAAAQAEQLGLLSAAARAHLATHPGDYAGAAAVATGRPIPKDNFSVPFPPLDEKGPVTRLNRGTGAVERVQPTQFATEANITASMTARKLTRAKAIEEYKKSGYDVSKIKP